MLRDKMRREIQFVMAWPLVPPSILLKYAASSIEISGFVKCVGLTLAHMYGFVKCVGLTPTHSGFCQMRRSDPCAFLRPLRIPDPCAFLLTHTTLRKNGNASGADPCPHGYGSNYCVSAGVDD